VCGRVQQYDRRIARLTDQFIARNQHAAHRNFPAFFRLARKIKGQTHPFFVFR